MIENKVLGYYFLVLLMIAIGISCYAFLVPAMLGYALRSDWEAVGKDFPIQEESEEKRSKK